MGVLNNKKSNKKRRSLSTKKNHFILNPISRQHLPHQAQHLLQGEIKNRYLNNQEVLRLDLNVQE